MAKKYEKLTRENMRKLSAGDYLTESGIVYKKLSNSDATFSVNLMVDGQRIRRSIGRESEGVTLAKVEIYIEQKKTEARENRLNLPKGRKNFLRFQEAADKYIENLKIESGKNVPQKQQQLRDYITPFFKNLIINNITSFDIERYKSHIVKEIGLSSTTANRHLSIVSHMFNKLLDWRMIDKVPFRIKKFKETANRITYLTPEQIQDILYFAQQDQNPYVFPFIYIGLDTAMRRAEILTIKLENIDTQNRTIYIPKAKAGARMQPISDNLAEFLDEYIKTVDKTQPWLFPSPKSKDGHFINIEKPFRRVVKAAGLDPKEIIRHTLRHTAISHLMQAGVDISTIQRISGHKTVQMVMRYSHQNDAHIREAMSKLQNRYNMTNNIENVSKRA